MGIAFSDVASEVGSVGAASSKTQANLRHIRSNRRFKEDEGFDEMSIEGEGNNDRYDYYDATGETASCTTKNQ